MMDKHPASDNCKTLSIKGVRHATSRSRVVFVADDDEAMRHSLAMLFQSVSLDVVLCASAEEFLWQFPRRTHCQCCLILDLRMPEMSGLDLLATISERGWQLPVIIITGHGDIRSAVQALKAGAQDYLEKPFRNQELLDKVQEAFRSENKARARQSACEAFGRQMSLLTDGEREVLALLLDGLSNKEIASRLFLSRRAIESRRAKLMRKLDVSNSTELIRKVVTYEFLSGSWYLSQLDSDSDSARGV